MNQATQLHQLEQSISMIEIHNSTIKSSKYTCMNQRNLNAITIATIHNEDGWGDVELAFHQADPGNTSSITTLSNGDSTLRELEGSSWPLTKLACNNPSSTNTRKKTTLTKTPQGMGWLA